MAFGGFRVQSENVESTTVVLWVGLVSRYCCPELLVERMFLQLHDHFETIELLRRGIFHW